MAKKKRQEEIDELDFFFDEVDELLSDESICLKEIPTLRLITLKSTGRTICFEQTGNVYRMSQDLNEEVIWGSAA